MGGGRNEEDGDGNGEAESGESMESDRGGALSERAVDIMISDHMDEKYTQASVPLMALSTPQSPPHEHSSQIGKLTLRFGKYGRGHRMTRVIYYSQINRRKAAAAIRLHLGFIRTYGQWHRSKHEDLG